MPWLLQASHLTVESFKLPGRLNHFLRKLLSRKYTDIGNPRVCLLRISFSQD